MTLLKKVLVIFFFLIPFSNSFAAMITFNDRTLVAKEDDTSVDDSGDHITGIHFNDETFIIKISKSKEENSQFAFDFDPLSNNLAKLSFSKDVGNFNYNLNSNMNLLSNISDYGVNLKISGTF